MLTDTIHIISLLPDQFLKFNSIQEIYLLSLRAILSIMFFTVCFLIKVREEIQYLPILAMETVLLS